MGQSLELCVCLNVCLRSDVWMHGRVQGVAVALLFSDAPLWRQVIPLLTTSLLFMSTRTGRAGHLMWACHKDFIWAWRTLFLATVLRAPVCSLILFDRPSFDLDKKGMRESPGGSLWVWRHFKILFFSLGNSRGVCLIGALKKCCIQHLLGDWLVQCCFTHMFISRQNGSYFGKSLICIGIKLIWHVLLEHRCHARVVQHFYSLF